VRVPAGVNTTVPAVELTATLPKFISTVLLMAIGVTMVADALAVAETCAKVLIEIPVSNRERAMILICAFIAFIFYLFQFSLIALLIQEQRYNDKRASPNTTLYVMALGSVLYAFIS
jgi:hypothetical protein